jgi:hypothetical protein
MELEKDIQMAICDYLAFKKHFFWRQNTSAIINHKTGNFKSMPKYSLNGVPDIILIKDGIFIGLEVKRPKGVQSENQKEFERRTKQAGAQYHIVTSIDDVQKLNL